MTRNEDTELRDAILALCLEKMTKGFSLTSIVTSFAACIDAAATCASVLPPKAREELIAATEGALLRHANQRARKVRSGELDRELTGH